MARLIDQAASLTESTTTSTTEQTKVTLNASLVSGKTYLLLASFATSISNTTDGIGTLVDIYDGSAVVGGNSFRLQQMEASDTTDYRQGFIAGLHTAGSTGSVAFTLRYRRVGASGTSAIKLARLIIIELDAADQSTSVASATTTSTSWQDGATLTFTPATSGDYLILAIGKKNSQANAGGIRLLLEDGSTVRNEVTAGAFSKAGNDQVPWAAFIRRTLAASSQTFKIQHRGDGTSNSGLVSGLVLVAIRVDQLYALQSTENTASESGTNTSYTTSCTLTATGLATATRKTIALAAFTYSADVNTISVGAQVTEAGSQLNETFLEMSAANRVACGFVACLSSVGGTSADYDIDRISETSGATAAIIYAAIAVIEFPLIGATYSEGVSLGVTPEFTAAAIAAFAQSISLGATVSAAGAVGNVVGVSALFGHLLAAAAAREYVAGVALTLDLELPFSMAVQGVFEPALALESVLDCSAAAALELSLSLDLGAILDQTALSGILYGASADLGLLLNWFTLPGAAYEDSLTWDLALGLEAANNLGDIVLSVDIALTLAQDAEGGREWVSAAALPLTLSAGFVPGNVLGLSVSFSQVLEASYLSDRGTLVSAVAFALAMETFAAAAKLAVGAAELGLALSAGVAVQGVLAPTVALGVGLAQALAVQAQIQPTALLGVGLGLLGAPGRIRSVGVSFGLRSGILGEIVDYDVLIEVEDILDFSHFSSFENWFTQEQGFSTSFTPKSGIVVDFDSVAGATTVYSQLGNYEDPEYQGPGQEG